MCTRPAGPCLQPAGATGGRAAPAATARWRPCKPTASMQRRRPCKPLLDAVRYGITDHPPWWLCILLVRRPAVADGRLPSAHVSRRVPHGVPRHAASNLAPLPTPLTALTCLEHTGHANIPDHAGRHCADPFNPGARHGRHNQRQAVARTVPASGSRAGTASRGLQGRHFHCFLAADLAEVINTCFLTSGINTLIQTLLGARLPIVQGGSFAYLSPVRGGGTFLAVCSEKHQL